MHPGNTTAIFISFSDAKGTFYTDSGIEKVAE